MQANDPTWLGISAHEAGHAVALYAWGHRFDRVRLGLNGGYGGGTKLTLLKDLDDRTQVELASVAVAGTLAEMRHYRGGPIELKGKDLALMLQGLQRFHQGDWKAFCRFTGADQFGRSRWTGFVFELAQSVIEADWAFVQRTAARLREQGELSWEDMEELYEGRLAG